MLGALCARFKVNSAPVLNFVGFLVLIGAQCVIFRGNVSVVVVVVVGDTRH